MTQPRYDENNREIMDQTPVAMPVGFEKPESLQSMIKRMVKNEKAMEEEFGQVETMEEADDFDVDESEDLHPEVTQYTLEDVIEEIPANVNDAREPEPEDPKDVTPKDPEPDPEPVA